VLIQEWRTRGGRVYDRSGVHKILMVRMFHRNWRNSECKSLKFQKVEIFSLLKMQGVWGQVRLVTMNNLILLKAVSTTQAQRNYLKVYVWIKVIGTW